MADKARLFQIFQTNQESGQLPVSRLGDAMRTAGMNPTDSEDALARWSSRDEAQELLSCFRVFDAGGTGYLARQKILEIMRMGGNDFAEAKLQEMLLDVPQNSQGLVEYKWLIPYLLGPVVQDVGPSSSSTPETQEPTENLEVLVRRFMEARVHQNLATENLEALLNKALVQASATGHTQVKMLLEKLAETEERLQEATADLAGRATRGDMKEALPEVAAKPEDESYDLQDRKAFAKFLIDADIRLVRGRFFKKLHRDGLTLPRRQEADFMAAGLLSALVTHEEVKIWAEAEEIEENTRPLDDWEVTERKAARQAKIVSVSHVWESREHADPHGYQLRKLAEAVDADAWYFYDYVSLYQFKRKVASHEKSFRRAMGNMHMLYAHEHSSTLRIESLTPADEMRMDATVLVYHAPSDEVKSVPVADLIANRTAYRDRGWCIAELCWSSTRSRGKLSKEIDEAEADTKGQAPMPPEMFVPLFKEKLQFTHRSDMDAVLKLQERVFHEKAQKNQILRLAKLSRAEAEVAIRALRHYPVLRRLDITGSRLEDVESFLLALFKALDSKSSITELCLADNELGVEDAMFVMRKVLNKNPSLRIVDLKKNNITAEGALMLSEALLQHPDAALKIELDGNDLGSGALILALALKCCQEQVILVHPSVKVLANSIQAPDFKVVFPSQPTFTDLCKLKSLSLSLTSEDFQWQLSVLAHALDTLRQFIDLSVNLNSQKIGDKGCQALCGEVSKMLQLTSLSLHLNNNSVGVEGCQALGDALPKLLQLTTFEMKLECNKVGSKGCQALGEGLCKLLQLTTLSLYLEGNNVGEIGCQALGDAVSKLLQMTTLSLHLCDFPDNGGPDMTIGKDGCEALGHGLCKLQRLTDLILSLGQYDCDPNVDALEKKLQHVPNKMINTIGLPFWVPGLDINRGSLWSVDGIPGPSTFQQNDPCFLEGKQDKTRIPSPNPSKFMRFEFFFSQNGENFWKFANEIVWVFEYY